MARRRRHERPRLVEVAVGDDPDAWLAAGFDVRDDVARVGEVRVRCLGRVAGAGARWWSFTGVAAGRVDGLDTRAGDLDEGSLPPHPNGAVAVDHVVILTPDGPRTVAALEALGLESRRTRAAGTEDAPMVQTFLRAGEPIVEVVAPARPTSGAALLWGLAVTVDDLDATVSDLGEVVGAARPAVQRDRRIATLRGSAVGVSPALAFMSPPPERA